MSISRCRSSHRSPAEAKAAEEARCKSGLTRVTTFPTAIKPSDPLHFERGKLTGDWFRGHHRGQRLGALLKGRTYDRTVISCSIRERSCSPALGDARCLCAKRFGNRFFKQLAACIAEQFYPAFALTYAAPCRRACRA